VLSPLWAEFGNLSDERLNCRNGRRASHLDDDSSDLLPAGVDGLGRVFLAEKRPEEVAEKRPEEVTAALTGFLDTRVRRPRRLA
jgi:hypothetical protein